MQGLLDPEAFHADQNYYRDRREYREQQADLHVPFAGAEFDEERDRVRLTRQIDCIREVALGAGWMTVPRLAVRCFLRFPLIKFPENSVSAQLRNLKKLGYRLERRHVANGLFEYRLLAPVNPGVGQAMREAVAGAQ